MQSPQLLQDGKTYQRIVDGRGWSGWDYHTENTKCINGWSYIWHRGSKTAASFILPIRNPQPEQV